MLDSDEGPAVTADTDVYNEGPADTDVHNEGPADTADTDVHDV